VSVTQGATNHGRGAFVGRRAELAIVAEAMNAAREGRPQLVVVEGEVGIGKTAFLRRCQDVADGFVVLAVGAEESEAGLDWGVVSQLIARAPAAGPEPGRTIDGSGSASNPFAVGAELLSLLGLLQDRGPVLLLLDDAHWIDPPSAAALLFALRRLYADQICALIATRPGDSSGRPGRARGPVIRRITGLNAAEPSGRRATARAHRRPSSLRPRVGRGVTRGVAELRTRAAAGTTFVR
jgi:hypothetical protein